MHFGVREFGMTALTNGIALHGGFVPFSATFLMFMEYARNALRLASLMGIRHMLVYTHDSVALGEDGPTHQPVEQLTNMRTTPHLSTWRPCDTVETAVAWRARDFPPQRSDRARVHSSEDEGAAALRSRVQCDRTRRLRARRRIIEAAGDRDRDRFRSGARRCRGQETR